MLLTKNSKATEKENKKVQTRVALEDSTCEKLEQALQELEGGFVKISLSQLANEAIIFYFHRAFAKERDFLKEKYFNAQAFLKAQISGLKTSEDVEKALRDALNKGKKKGRKKKTENIVH